MIVCVPAVQNGNRAASFVNSIRQAAFANNKDYRFNLHLTDALLERIETARASARVLAICSPSARACIRGMFGRNSS